MNKKELSDFLTEVPFRMMIVGTGLTGFLFATLQTAIAQGAFERASELYPLYPLSATGHAAIGTISAGVGLGSLYLGARFCYTGFKKEFSF